MYEYKKQKGKVKEYIKTIVIILLLGILSVLLYDMYIDIDISDYDQGKYKSTKLEQTMSNGNVETDEVIEKIEEVSQCVVGISKLKDNGSSIFLKNSNSELAIGTGIIISGDGYILTNQHVSGNKYSNCYVTLYNGKEYNANVIWADEDIDLSVIKINVKGLTYANLGDSDNIKVGQKVYAIGNPIGFEFQRTVTSGIISAKNRTIKIEEENKQSYMEDLIQTDATINPGNSGGPLIKSDGTVIGINTVKITSAEGIGFAMPINIIKPIISRITENGNFEEASIGIFAYDKEVIPYLNSNINFNNGIYVAQVKLDGEASKAGVKEGDIITKIDNIELNKMSELRKYIYTKNPNDNVNLTILRNNKTININVKLEKKL